jgi:DNA-binding CsgD family transcriptional regulator
MTWNFFFLAKIGKYANYIRMITISAHDEFKVLERVQECAGDPSLWPSVLECVERSLKCRPYLLEFDSGLKHTARYCPDSEADALLALLDKVQTESNKSALFFLLDQAALNYPYCKTELTTPATAPVQEATFIEPEVSKWPGLITPVLRKPDKIILLACFWTTLTVDEIDPDYVMQPFRRLSKAVSSALDFEDRLSETAMHRDALQLMCANQKSTFCLIDEDLSIHFSTPSCTDLFRDGEIFKANGNRLVPVIKELDTALSSVSRHVIETKKPFSPRHYMSTPPLPEQSVFFPDNKNALCHVSIKSLKPTVDATLPEDRSYILVEVKKPTPVYEDLKALLQSAFGLSNGEARLAHKLASNGSLPETLEDLKITRNTAKTHLRRIYEKTGTQSQLELTQLILSLGGLF